VGELRQLSVFTDDRRPSTYISMPCISSQQTATQRHQHAGHLCRAGLGHGLTPRRFLPTLSISEEVSISPVGLHLSWLQPSRGDHTDY